MTDAWGRPGHGPADPQGYRIERTPDGYRWTCRADGRTGGPYPSREDAVAAAEAHRTAWCSTGSRRPDDAADTGG